LKYLRADVEGLFEVVKLISKEFFDKFSLNMTEFYTLPPLHLQHMSAPLKKKRKEKKSKAPPPSYISPRNRRTEGPKERPPLQVLVEGGGGPGLTIAAYFSNYHNSDHQIKMIKGQVEKDIRSAYHGGVINVYNNQEIKNAYYYDINSQYPNAMLGDIPLGNPVFSTDKNLDNIFGFVYGKI